MNSDQCFDGINDGGMVGANEYRFVTVYSDIRLETVKQKTYVLYIYISIQDQVKGTAIHYGDFCMRD